MTNYEHLFGTPERAAQTMAAAMYVRATEDAVVSIALSKHGDYADLAKRSVRTFEEWLLGWLNGECVDEIAEERSGR